jgi:hypothetical protein
MVQLIDEISALLDGDRGRRTAWEWASRGSRAWELLWTAASLVGLLEPIRRPVAIPVRSRYRGVLRQRGLSR